MRIYFLGLALAFGLALVFGLAFGFAFSALTGSIGIPQQIKSQGVHPQGSSTMITSPQSSHVYFSPFFFAKSFHLFELLCYIFYLCILIKLSKFSKDIRDDMKLANSYQRLLNSTIPLHSLFQSILCFASFVLT